MIEPIVLDGAKGGQVLRTGIGLSCLTQKPVKLVNIRSSREKQGLQPQHLTCVRTLGQLCGASIEGAWLNSSQVLFVSKKVKPLQLVVNIGTAGSISLLVQAGLFPGLVEKTKLRVMGGTNVPFAPPIEFFSSVLFPSLKTMGARFELETSVRGYFPKGKGVVSFASSPARFPLKPVQLLERGKSESVKLVSHCSSLPRDVCLRQVSAAKKALSSLAVDFVEEISVRENGYSKGSGLSLFLRFSSGAVLSSSALGAPNKTAEAVGTEAAQKLLKQVNQTGSCDSFLADQLVPFLALAKGKSRLSVTCLDEHVFSNIEVCEKLLDCRFEVSGKVGESGEIACQGSAFVPDEKE